MRSWAQSGGSPPLQSEQHICPCRHCPWAQRLPDSVCSSSREHGAQDITGGWHPRQLEQTGEEQLCCALGGVSIS